MDRVMDRAETVQPRPSVTVQVWALGMVVIFLSTLALGYWSTSRNALFEVLVLGAFSGFMWKFAPGLSELPLTRKNATIIAAGAAGAYGIVIFLVQAYMVRRYARPEADTGLFIQSLWWTLHGSPFFNTLEGTSHLGIHSSFFLVVLLPFYAVWHSPLLLFLAQDVALALGGWVLFTVARRWIDDVTSLCLLGVFLLFPAYQYGFGIFYEASLAPPLLLLTFDSALRKRWVPCIVWAILLMSVKETFAVTVALLGLYLLIRQREKIGAFIAVLGAVWLAAMIFVVMPWFRSHYRAFSPNSFGFRGITDIGAFSHLGTSVGGILHTIVFHPGTALSTVTQVEKLQYLILIVAPYLVGGILGSVFWLLALPDLVISLLVNHSQVQQFTGDRFAMMVATAFAISALLTFQRISSRHTRQLLASAMLFSTVALLPNWINTTRLRSTPRPGAAQLRTFAKRIGPNAAVAGPEWSVQLLANRRVIIDYGRGNLSQVILKCSQYVILDTTHAATQLRPVIQAGGFREIRSAKGLQLWKSPTKPHCSSQHLPWVPASVHR